MSAQDKLLEALKNHPLVQAYKDIETTLINHPKYHQDYQNLLKAQKKMVQSIHAKSTSSKEDTEAYQTQLESLKNAPLVQEYLALQEEVNALVQSLVTTIEQGLKPSEGNTPKSNGETHD